MSRVIDTSDLSALSDSDIQYLKDRGLLSPEQEQEIGSEVDTSDPEDEDAADGPYEQWTKAELLEETEARNEAGADLSVSGTKAELAEQLREHDSEDEE